MTVRCPGCGTGYRLPRRSKLGARPTFRCTRCEHVFDPEAGADGPALDQDAEARGPATMFAPAPGDPDAGGEEDDVHAEHAGGEAWAQEPEEAEAPVDAAEAARRPPRRRPARRDAEASGGDAEEPANAGTTRFALRTLLIVTIAYAVLSIWLYTHPERVAELLADIPIIGPPMSEARISPANIQLADVRGDYHRLQGETLVFAITGTALNNAPVPVSGVQIQGTVHGDVEQRLTVFAGAVPRAVPELTVREIDLLQTLVPPADWSLAPGGQASFLVVFKEPAVPLAEFSAEVVAVRRSERRAGQRTTAAR